MWITNSRIKTSMRENKIGTCGEREKEKKRENKWIK